MRVRFEWESMQEEEMLRYISSGILKRKVKDLQVWGGNASAKYSTKSAYNRLANHATGVHRGFSISSGKLKHSPIP